MFKLTKEQQNMIDERSALLDKLQDKLKEICYKISSSSYKSKEELRNLYSICDDIKKQFDDLIYDDLFLVGKDKALGYLPIATIEQFGRDADFFVRYAKRNKLKSILIPKCNVGSGALYIYSEDMLSNILNENRKVLKSANVPYKCREYVNHIANNVVSYDTNPDAFVIVGKTFNDIRFRD